MHYKHFFFLWSALAQTRLLDRSWRTQWHFPVPDSPLLSVPGEGNGWGLFMKPLPPAWSIKPRRDDTKSSVCADRAQPFTWTIALAGTRLIQECLKVGHLKFWETRLLFKMLCVQIRRHSNSNQALQITSEVTVIKIIIMSHFGVCIK